MNAGMIPSSIPSITPPANAPIGFPNPPSTPITKLLTSYPPPDNMLKGNKVAIRAPETAASMVPKPKLNARTRVDGIPINSAAARLFATARMNFPGRVR